MKFFLSDIGTLLSSCSSLSTTILVAWGGVNKERERELHQIQILSLSLYLVAEFQNHIAEAKTVFIVTDRSGRVCRGDRRGREAGSCQSQASS